MGRVLHSTELEKLHSNDLTIFGSGSSCVEFLEYIYSKGIKPNKITIVDSFKNGSLESPFGKLAITKMNPNKEFVGKLIIASCQWHSILNYWASDLPNDFFILSNELIHLAN